MKNLRFFLLLPLLVMCGCSHAAMRTAQAGRFEDLGVQITSQNIQGTTFTKDPAGRDVVCTVIRGQPAKLLVFDVSSGNLLHRLALDGANGGWNACTASDGSVYVSTDDNGHLYRWVPGTSEAKDLGKVAPEQTFAWDCAGGADGEVFVASYPGCLVTRYHPNEGFKDVGSGSVAPGENYARGIAYDKQSGKVYVSVGAHAHLIELDPKTGSKRDILPEKYHGPRFCYSVEVADGRVFGLVTEMETFVMDAGSGRIEGIIPDAQAQLVLSEKSPKGDRVYYNAPNKLGWYDLKTHEHGIALEGAGGIFGLRWVGEKLAIFTKTNGIQLFDPGTKQVARVKVEIPPEPTPIHYIAAGNDGKIYCGGYLSGGFAVVDPETGKGQHFAGYLPQTEGITAYKERMYMGCYPHARLYRFDTNKPWDLKKDNPHQIDELHRVGQDRPFAALGVESMGKVFFGHVPDYGTLGGALAVVDFASDKVDVYRNIIPDQSIVSLVQSENLIIGGTAIRGGLGVPPTQKDAKLFIWDPQTNKVVYETVPVPGARLITGLYAMPDKTIWGFGEGTLFIFDPAQRRIVKTKHLVDLTIDPNNPGWRSAMIALHPNGQIYGTFNKFGLFQLDPKTLKLTVLYRSPKDKEFGALALDRAGRVYYREAANLWRFTP